MRSRLFRRLKMIEKRRRREALTHGPPRKTRHPAVKRRARYLREELT